MATSAQAQTSGKARPFKATGIPTIVANPDGMSGTFEMVGTATHLGNFVFPGTYQVIGVGGPGIFLLHIIGTYTAANGDTIKIDCPDWVSDYSVSPVKSYGLVNIIGGTGRFANASGSYVGALLGAVSPGDAPTLFIAQGTIAY
jgi:hypothetical protein